MTKPVENDGTWNTYKDIVSESEVLEDDIRRPHAEHGDLEAFVDARGKLMVTREELYSYIENKESK